MKEYDRTIDRAVGERTRGDEMINDTACGTEPGTAEMVNCYQTLFDTLALGVVYQSADGEIRSANPEAERILGLSTIELQRRTLADPCWAAIREDGSEFPCQEHPSTVAVRTGKEVRDVVMGIRDPRTEELRWINASAVPQFQGKEETPHQVITTLADITEHRQVAEKLQQRNVQLELLNRSGHTFNSTLDLDTILFTVLEEVRFLLDVTICSVWLVDPETGELVCHQATDPGRETVQGWRLPIGIGIAGWSADHHESLIVPDAQQDNRHYRELDELTGLVSRSMLALPLLAREDLIGVLEVVDERADCFDATHLAVLELVAASAANAIDNARLIQNQREQWELAEALGTAAAIVNSSLKIETVLDRILAQVQRVVAGDTFNVMLVEGYMARIVRSRGYEEMGVVHIMPTGEIPVASFPSLLEMVQTGDSTLIRDTTTEPTWVRREIQDWRSYVGAPISVDGRVVGFLNVNGTRPGQFRPADARRLRTFANYAATAIENARLFEQTQLEISERIRAENALRESEERFRKLSQASEEGIAVHDHGIIADANEALARMFGYQFAEMIATRLDRYFTVDSWQTVAELIPTGFERPHEVVGVRKDGSTFYCEMDGKPYQYRSKTLNVAILRDITERKRNEEELRRRAAQQEALNAIIATAAAASDIAELLDVILDLALKAVELETGAIWTADHHTTRGIPRGRDRELIQQLRTATLDMSAFHSVEDWQTSVPESQLSNSAIITGLGIRASFAVPILVDNRRIGGVCLATNLPRSWSPEEIALVESIGQQIGAAAERLRLLGEIRKQAHQMQKIIDTVPDGVLLLDETQEIALTNPVGEEYLVTLAGARVGEKLTRLGSHPLEGLLAPPPEGRWHEIEIQGPARRIFEIVARPVESSHDTQSWVLAIRDVTHERQRELQTRRQERLAAVGQLAAGIAHDFRNIMAVITLYTQMTKMMPDLSPEVVRRLGTVEHQAKRAGDLIQQVLDFSRRSVFERKPVDLLPLLAEHVELLERTVPESVEISLHCTPPYQAADGSNEFMISADPTRIQQVIMNLALNARDAMPGGGELRIELGRIQIGASQEVPLPGMEEGTDAWISIAVADTGEGVAPDALPHIFEPFFTTKAAGKGTGLGLAQVYGIVKQHGGHIDVKSELGVGTTFTIYLPALAISGPLHGAAAAEALLHGRGETVLVVEDNPITRRAFVESLEGLDYHVLEAQNGSIALGLFDEYKAEIALVVSDLIMPGMSGKALVKALRQKDPSLPIIVLSGHPKGESVEELEEAGLVEWLQKPVGLEQLARVVNMALTKNSDNV